MFIVAALLACLCAVLLADDNSRFANVIFVLVGGLLTVATTLVAEESRNAVKVKSLARALHIELADRLARCCFDFEAPWGAYVAGRSTRPMGRVRLLKFEPVQPIIYRAAAAEIALLPSDAPQALLQFYYALDAWRRDLTNTAPNWDAETGPPPATTSLLALRLFQTLRPGLAALTALGEHVPNAELLEDAALAAYDVDRTNGIPRSTNLRVRVAALLSEGAPK